ncbi:MAG TPA: ABC transporter ATP-binding protein, partial [Sphingobacteriaceae bacterium]
QVEGITCHYNEESVLHTVSFTQGEFEKIAIAGETGSGKSTLLKIIAGLEQPDSGEVRFNGHRVEGPSEKLVPGHPSIAFLSQHFELPQFLRVEQVLEYESKVGDSYAATLYEICRIDHLMKRRTDQLSGGERQRIAIARLLIGRPTLLMLDEPFSHLDMVQKNTLKEVIHDVSEQLKISLILISHDPQDTLSWADRIIVMRKGLIVQSGSAQAIYENPADEYVAGLFGKFCRLNSAQVRELLEPEKIQKGKQACVRPENLRIVGAKIAHFTAKVSSTNFFGSYNEVNVKAGKSPLTIQLAHKLKLPKRGEEVGVRVQASRVFWV